MLFPRLVLLISALVVGVDAVVNETDVTARLPSCAIKCFARILPSPAVVLSDPAIACRNVTLQTPLSSCLLFSCTRQELFRTHLIQNEICAGVAVDTRARFTAVAVTTCTTLAILAVGIRCYSRLTINKRLQADDWAIIVAASLLLSSNIITFLDIEVGFGLHVWNIDPPKIITLGKLFWAAEIIYPFNVSMVKLSILLFYHRVFISPSFRIINYIVMASVIAFGITVAFIAVFQCNPISAAWEPTLGVKCINMKLVFFSSTGVSVGQDIVILTMPIPQLATLDMSWRKINPMIMFGVGIIACITSIVRLNFLVTFGDTQDPTFDNVNLTVWSAIENSVATICACLPAIRALFSHWMPKVFKTTRIKQPVNPISTVNSQRLSKLDPAEPFAAASSRRMSHYKEIGSVAGSPRVSRYPFTAPNRGLSVRSDFVVVNTMPDNQASELYAAPLVVKTVPQFHKNRALERIWVNQHEYDLRDADVLAKGIPITRPVLREPHPGVQIYYTNEVDDEHEGIELQILKVQRKRQGNDDDIV